MVDYIKHLVADYLHCFMQCEGVVLIEKLDHVEQCGIQPSCSKVSMCKDVSFEFSTYKFLLNYRNQTNRKFLITMDR